MSPGDRPGAGRTPSAAVTSGPVTGTRKSAIVGVADHAGWAILVAVAGGGTLLDRRRVRLVDDGLPSLPHHTQGQRLPLDQAVALVERVRRSAASCAALRLEELAESVSTPIAGIALRACPPLPATVAERITSYHAQTRADTVMYREVLAEAARARGWLVRWYEPKRVFAEAASVLGRQTVEDLIAETGARLGPPWQRDHRMAMAAAIAASSSE